MSLWKKCIRYKHASVKYGGTFYVVHVPLQVPVLYAVEVLGTLQGTCTVSQVVVYAVHVPVSLYVVHVPLTQVPVAQSVSVRHSRRVRSIVSSMQASYGEFSTLKPSGQLQVGRWFTGEHTALVPHPVNRGQGSEQLPSRHSFSSGQSLLKLQPSTQEPYSQICPKGQLLSAWHPARHTFSEQYSPARQCAS